MGGEKVPCDVCRREFKPQADGQTPWRHKCEPEPTPTEEPTITGSAHYVGPNPSGKGPWFGAQFAGGCDQCGSYIEEGDMVRADGQGGWECEQWCGQDDPVEPMGDPATEIGFTTNRPPRPAQGYQEEVEALIGLSGRLSEAGEVMRAAVQLSEAAPCGYIPEQGPACDWDPECTDHFPKPEPVSEAAPTVVAMDDANAFLLGPQGGAVAGAPDLFEDPGEAWDPEPEVNVSGQPPARYEWRGSVNMGYLVVDPELGDFRRYKNKKPKGLTRATTFNKAASDSKAINDWGKRNVVIGASRRPDVIDRADGFTHELNRDELNNIVWELEEAAGAKVSADQGTYLHSFTEQMDAGLKTADDAPARYRAQLALYAQALADAGFEPVPGLIERTTMIREFGGVVGTFDRVLYHRPSGTYMIGDLKTGKTMGYAMDETETQEWTYAHGVNQNGVYDWNTDTWTRQYGPADGWMPPIREDVGVIIHMPVQGKQAGQVILIEADLKAGAEHAKLCHAIRSRPKSKVTVWDNDRIVSVPVSEPVSDPVAALDWVDMFASVQTREEARELYDRAYTAGLLGTELKALVELAQQALSRG